MKRFRHFLFKYFGIDWWERLGYSTDPKDGICSSHIIDVRRSRITGEMEQLYYVGSWWFHWMPIDEEFKGRIEREND